MRMDGVAMKNYFIVFLTILSCSLSILNHIRYNGLEVERENESTKETSTRIRRSAELDESPLPSSTPYTSKDEDSANLLKNVEELQTFIKVLDKRLKDVEKCECSNSGVTDKPKGPKGERGLPGPPGPRGPRGPRGLGLYPPLIRENKLDINATKNDTVLFTCQFFGNPLPKISWKSSISNKEINQSIDWEESVVTSRLIARNVDWEDRGNVTCSASNILGTENKTGTLRVHAPPQILLPKGPIIGIIGLPVTFPRCEILSDPKYHVIWERGFPGLSQHRTYNINGKLKISSLKLDDQGYYKCIAKNYLGTESRYIFLKVHELSFTKKPDPYIYKSDTSVLLICGTYGSAGLVDGKWLNSEGILLPSTKEYRYKNYTHEMILSTKVDQSGRFRCVISNHLTSIETATTVQLFSLNSSLLNDTQVNTLGKWMIERSSHGRYDLCWSGSKHGFKTSLFRSRCGGKSNTISIIKTEDDTVVGGFSDIPWMSYEDRSKPNDVIEKQCNDYIKNPGKYTVELGSRSCSLLFQLSEASTIEILSTRFYYTSCSNNDFAVTDSIANSKKFCKSELGKGKLFFLNHGSGKIEFRLPYQRQKFMMIIKTVKYRYSSLAFVYALQPMEIVSPIKDENKAICDFESFGVCFGRLDLFYQERSINISHVESYKRSFLNNGVDPFKKGNYNVKDIEVHYKV